MSTISTIQKRLQALNIQEVAADAIEESSDVILREQKNQLLRGERADGKKIGRYRSPIYAAKKAALNPLAGFGNMDWRLTGALHNNIFLDVRDASFVLDSGDPKMGKLVEEFGDPMGLGTESRVKVIDEKLGRVFRDEIGKKTGL